MQDSRIFIYLNIEFAVSECTYIYDCYVIVEVQLHVVQ